MKKIILSLIVFLFCAFSANADEISRHIKQSSLGKDSNVALYVINSDNKKVLYKKNEDLVLNPASILKLLTFGATYSMLGENYKFETALYKDDLNNYYIKLGGDVLLKQQDLNKLISNIKNADFNKIYIDDTIIEHDVYPSSWLNEDKWPNSRIVTPYIVDNNFIQVAINRSSLSKKVEIVQKDGYQIPIINNLTISDKTKYEISKINNNDLVLIDFNGQIAKDEVANLPVLEPELNFNIKLMDAFKKNNIIYDGIFEKKQVPSEATKVAFIAHTIEEISKNVLHNSDNFASEVVFRVAGAKYINYTKQASLDEAISMFNEMYKNYLSKDDIIADASGVSRENNFSAKTIALILNDLLLNESYKKLLPAPNDGTLNQRLYFLNNNLKAKTGTMRNVSALAGNFKTRKNTNITFVSIINNSTKRNSLLKNYEDILISKIYKKY